MARDGRPLKVVSLSVHRNTLQKRRERIASRNLVSDAKAMARRKDVAGYAIVAWAKNTDADVAWCVTDEVNCSVMPEFVRGAIQRKISMEDND